MRYLDRVTIDKIINDYDKVVAWGTGPIFKMNYRPEYYHIDFLIDGTGKEAGKEYKGLDIRGENALQDIGKTLIVIYAIYEKEILEQIAKYDKGNIDVIIYSLLSITLDGNVQVPMINGKSCEDLLVFSVINQLKMEDISYLEIGVCHPIMRNNTYLLYEQFTKWRKGSKGVLVEANPICWPLIKDYRPKDELVMAGINAKKNEGTLDFYMFPNLLGHSTFSKELADIEKSKGYKYEVLDIPVRTINDVIEEYFGFAPDVLALDAEGMDFDIICSLDVMKYPIKIIITEVMENNDLPIENFMNGLGYRQYARTMENIIWVHKEYEIFV